MPETPYAEADALLALLAGDQERALELVAQLLPGERLALRDAARHLADIADPGSYCPGCHRYVPAGEAAGGYLHAGDRWCRGCWPAHFRASLPSGKRSAYDMIQRLAAKTNQEES